MAICATIVDELDERVYDLGIVHLIRENAESSGGQENHKPLILDLLSTSSNIELRKEV